MSLLRRMFHTNQLLFEVTQNVCSTFAAILINFKIPFLDDAFSVLLSPNCMWIDWIIRDWAGVA